MVRKTDLTHFSSFNITSYFIYTDLISSLLDARLVGPLIHIGAYEVKKVYALRKK